MKVEISKLGSIFAGALYDELKSALLKDVYTNKDGYEVVYYGDVLKAIEKVLGIEGDT